MAFLRKGNRFRSGWARGQLSVRFGAGPRGGGAFLGAGLSAFGYPYVAGAVQSAAAAATGRRQSAVSDAFLVAGPDYGGPDRTWGRLLFPVCGAAADRRVAGGSGAAAAACRTGILVRFVLVRRNRYCQITSLRVK